MVTEDKSGQFDRGLRAFRSGDFQTAVELLSEAVEYDEQNDRAWNALGTACAKIGRYEDADLCFGNAITIAPDNPVYQKNRRTNIRHLKNPPPLSERSGRGKILDHISLGKIPIDRPFLLVGIAIGLIIIIGFLLISSLSFFSAPATPPGPSISLAVNQTGSSVILVNKGGREIGSVASFTWKINNLAIGNGRPDDPETLGIKAGSTAVVPLSELTSTNLSAGMKVMVIATYKDGSQTLVLSTTLPPPSPGTIPSQAITPVGTPTLPSDIPMFKKGEVILDANSNTWWLITTAPVNNTYILSRAARLPNGTFTSLGSTVTNMSVKTLDQTGKIIGTQGPGGTPAGLPDLVPPPVIGIPATHPQPIYPAGDLVNPSPTGDTGMMVILGYDPVTDQYQTDNIYRYYTGDWGYRVNTTPMWFIRPVLEQTYPQRSGRIATSDIGIGADSSPPRSPVKYGPGDIVSPDPSGIDQASVIIEYNKTDDRYQINTITPAYDGGWKIGDTPAWEKRAFVERDNPYLLRKIDLSLVRG